MNGDLKIEHTPERGRDAAPWTSEFLARTGNTGFWTILLDPQGGESAMLVNDAMLSLLGLDVHLSPQACREHWFSRIRPDYAALVTQTMEAIFVTGRQHEVEYLWNLPGWAGFS